MRRQPDVGAHLDTATISLLPRDTLKGGHLTGPQQFGVHPLGCSSWRVKRGQVRALQSLWLRRKPCWTHRSLSLRRRRARS